MVCTTSSLTFKGRVTLYIKLEDSKTADVDDITKTVTDIIDPQARKERVIKTPSA